MFSIFRLSCRRSVPVQIDKKVLMEKGGEPENDVRRCAFCGSNPMKTLIRIAVCLGVLVASSTTSSACLWPFGGMWGAGYYGTPVSYSNYGAAGYYSAGYAPWSMGTYGTGYAVNYGSTSSACCAPRCCDPCAGGCANGSCDGAVVPAGSLRPTTDPNFGTGTKDSDYERDLKDDRSNPAPRRKSSSDESTDPLNEDDFRTSPRRKGTDGTDPMFDSQTEDQINQRPEMPDLQDLPAADPDGTKTDEKTFLPDQDKNAGGPQAGRNLPSQSRLAARSSGINEVIGLKRLAARSLPSRRDGQVTSFAGRTDEKQSATTAPVRWISVPEPDGRVRL